MDVSAYFKYIPRGLLAFAILFTINFAFWYTSILLFSKNQNIDKETQIVISCCLSIGSLLAIYNTVFFLLNNLKVDIVYMSIITIFIICFFHCIIMLICQRLNIGFSTLLNIHISIWIIPFGISVFKPISIILKAEKAARKKKKTKPL